MKTAVEFSHRPITFGKDALVSSGEGGKDSGFGRVVKVTAQMCWGCRIRTQRKHTAWTHMVGRAPTAKKNWASCGHYVTHLQFTKGS